MKLEIFKNNEFGGIRVLAEKGEPWFVLSDVCKILGLSNPTKVANTIDKDDLTIIQVTDNLGRIQKVNAVNESGLYQVIFQSRKSEAKKFKKWVTSEVLPAIRKYGLYATDEVIEKTLNNPDFMISILQKLKEEKEARERAEEKIVILTHTNKLYTSTEIAKELGFKSAIAFNRRLKELGVQFKVNGTWVLSAKYANLGYESIKQEVLDNGKVIYDRKWTQLGREFLLNLFKRIER